MLQVMLQKAQPLKVWEKIDIIVGEGPDAGRYVSRIEDFINNGIIINQPEYIEGNILLREGVVVTVRVTRNDAAYQFQSTVRHSSHNNIKYLILTPPKNIQRVQRRLFVRIDLSDRVRYANLAPVKNGVIDLENLSWQQTYTLDISGGQIDTTSPARARTIRPSCSASRTTCAATPAFGSNDLLLRRSATSSIPPTRPRPRASPTNG